MVKVIKTIYLGIEAYEITNGKVSLIMLTGVGPRIISFGFIKKESVLRVAINDFMSDEDCYKFYGGHRLWSAPEDEIRSYLKDNKPCKVEVLELGIKATKVEEENGLEVSMQVEMKENGRVRIIHTIKNLSSDCKELATWGITQLKRGGTAIIMQDDRKTGLLPNRTLSLWDYSDLSDKRVKFSKNFIYVNQDDSVEKPFKIGTYNREGIAYYFIDGDLFTKEFDVFEGEHCDFGCNCEIYVNGEFLELESLSKLSHLHKGDEIAHTEVWSLTEKTDLMETLKTLQLKETTHA